MNTLNNFELAILERIAAKYPFVQAHIPLLCVQSRKNTGVGMYVNFHYKDTDISFEAIPANYIALSAGSHLNMDGLQHGLVHEVAITGGRIDFLELATYGFEQWDGIIRNYWFDE